MTAFLYAIGSIFFVLAFFTTTPWVAAIAAAFYLTNDPAAGLLEKHFSSFTWYAYFALVCSAFGIYLFSRGSELLIVAGIACFAAALLTMLASKLAVMDGYFSRTYDTWFGVTHGVLIAMLLLYFGNHLKLPG